MLMRTGQLVPCIGHRSDLGHPRTVICDGQRRLLAAIASAKLAGAEGYEDLAPVQSLIVLLLDHEPGADEIRRIQAQANQRESLFLVDQQEQRDCWEARAGLPEPDRIAWTDPERQPPVGDSGRHEPRQPDTILDAELDRALADPDPLRGIAQITVRWASAFVLDPAGVTRTKALDRERIERKLRDALPGGRGRTTARRGVGAGATDTLARARRAEPRRVRDR
jgi:hypothetical protein